jgi:hypothetical protein
MSNNNNLGIDVSGWSEKSEVNYDITGLSASVEMPKSSESTQHYITDNDIVPEDIQNELMHWREVNKLSSFRIGDITNDLIMRAAQTGYDVTHERIFKAVGNFCDRKPRTVRYCWETSSFFTPDVREQYDQLSFSTFVFARMLGERWQDVLEYAAEQPKISVDALQMHFMTTPLHVQDVTTDQFDTCAPTSDQPCACAPAPTRIPDGAVSAGLLSNLCTVIDSLGRLLDRLPLRDATKTNLRDALQVIKKYMPEITQATQSIDNIQNTVVQ